MEADTLTQKCTGSNLEHLLAKFQDQMRRIDDLEDKLNAKAVRTRRRIASVLDQHYSAEQRQSHLRFWVTHHTAKNKEEVKPQQQSSTADNSNVHPPSVPTPPTYTLQLEGCLLIGNLDHASAHDFDKQTKYQAPQDDLDRSRGGDKEDEVVIPAYRLTHLFRQLQVEFQTVYQPATPKPSSSSATAVPKKTTRRSSDSGISPTKKKKKGKKQPVVDPAQIQLRNCILSPRQKLTWKKEMTDDAHAWALDYTPPPPPQSGFEVHSVIARISLFPQAPDMSRTHRRSHRYSIRHPRLVKEVFPHHGLPVADPEAAQQQEQKQQQQQQEDQNKKRKMPEEWTTADGNPLPPLDNVLQVQPATLTLSEIMMALFTYVRNNKLMANQQPAENRVPGEDDKSVIVCDDLLQEVLGMERLSFSQLQATLFQRNAVVPVMQPPPVKATYIMSPLPVPTTTPDHSSNDNDEGPAPWQWDMECSIPHLFPYRARELLRRVKRRELEYTSARTKGRYLLASTLRNTRSTDEVRQLVESSVATSNSAHDTNTSMVPQVVWHALAKGAPPHTEARRAAQLEAQSTYLRRDVLPGPCRAAQAAQELVELCGKWKDEKKKD